MVRSGLFNLRGVMLIYISYNADEFISGVVCLVSHYLIDHATSKGVKLKKAYALDRRSLDTAVRDFHYSVAHIRNGYDCRYRESQVHLTVIFYSVIVLLVLKKYYYVFDW